MKNLEKRITTIEAQCVAEKTHDPAWDEAFGRLYTAMRAALPDEAQIIGPNDRREAGEMTDADHQVMNMLPEDDLTIIDLKAVDFVAVFAFVFKSI
jgi:hypothetical protein